MEQVFSRSGQLSEVNVDPDSLSDSGMFSIMVNKLAYKPSVKDIMDKYHEMFHVKNSVNKEVFFNIPFNNPDIPDHSDQDSDSDG